MEYHIINDIPFLFFIIMSMEISLSEILHLKQLALLCTADATVPGKFTNPEKPLIPNLTISRESLETLTPQSHSM